MLFITDCTETRPYKHVISIRKVRGHTSLRDTLKSKKGKLCKLQWALYPYPLHPSSSYVYEAMLDSVSARWEAFPIVKVCYIPSINAIICLGVGLIGILIPNSYH